MLSRNNHDQKGTALPQEWINDSCQLLEAAFKGKFSPEKNRFFVFGQTFQNEIFIAVSLLDKLDESQLPVTYCISCDIKPDQNNSKLLQHMIDSTGIFFDSFFGTTDWNEYCSNWTKFNYKGFELYYIVTRENIDLTLKADELLRD